MELIAKVTTQISPLTYDGGNPAVVATVSGEADVTTQLAVEQADMHPRQAASAAEPSATSARTRGLRTIPHCRRPLAGFTAPTNYFGIFIRRAAGDVIARSTRSGRKPSKSDAVKKYATSRGRAVLRHRRASRAKAVFPAVQANAWLLVRRGKGQSVAGYGGYSQTLGGSMSSPNRLRRHRHPTGRKPSPPCAVISCRRSLDRFGVAIRSGR